MNHKLIAAAAVAGAAVAAFALARPVTVAACGSKCGVVRWAVKTIGTATVPKTWDNVTATVDQMNDIVAPSPYPGHSAGRTATTETTFFTVDACLWGITAQKDKDYHLMINDLSDKTKTMIAEVPSTTCWDACDSPYEKQYDAVRAELEKSSTLRASVALAIARRAALMKSAATRNEPGVALVKYPIELSLLGAGFWDTRNHGKGHSANGVELHPLVAIKISSKACTPPSAAQIKSMLAEPDDD